MSITGAIVILALIACFTYLRVQKYKALGSKRQAGDGDREAELEHEVERLHKRIAVLERIALEEHSREELNREIASLRD